MYIKTNRAKSTSGKITKSKLLCKSYWENGTSKTRTICNISKLSTKLQLAIEQSLKKGTSVVMEDITIEESIDYGHFLVIMEIIKRLKIKVVHD